ncbi:MAG: 3-hydroxyacyl-CoA dehydrogenase family protein [Bacteroidetes bacterium]|jgi:3-hydroxybutyryl-CoA dehydrogenase|nr:3-hydroxyacyl-CoA dehydrogenase family protein [Bacteroidota bacterium]MBT6686846.1 3-hydroxyacyl-CoA dehydrogenase family protein [Bacteroidota bacterium]MBT7144175.1 3-hydroxyacyl-CoA dehydrogenase family protein [Bacteroidota bacterium]MBT7491894.1 3-hydroxyacyl-CoA dehydrogenase family protein [Bacteroidota bacterium]
MATKVEAIEKYGLNKEAKPKALFEKIGIIGCGMVGREIAIMVSRHGIEVVFIEISEGMIEYAYRKLDEELDEMIGHWGMTAGEKRAILTRIHGSIYCKDLEGCGIVIEAIKSKTREDSVEKRKEIFKRIEQNVSPETIIATNSTTLVITELSSELEHKERCISLHFSTVAPDTHLVEVVKGLNTSEEVYANAKKFLKLIDRIGVPVEESPGLISVRIFIPLINEACEVLMEGIAKLEDIDYTMRMALGQRLGPFEIADKIGLDKVVRWMNNLYNEFGDIRYKPSPVLKRLVRGNRLGRKTLIGFYKYDEHGNKIS